MASGPNATELIRPLAEVEGMEVNVGFIGSCAGGRFTDLAQAAQVLRGHKVKPYFRLFVTPISQEVMREATSAGIIQVLVEAGAVITHPGCGACYLESCTPLKLGEGERCIASSTEASKGRMGSPDAEIVLANTAVVAASAIEGKITNPTSYLYKQKEV